MFKSDKVIKTVMNRLYEAEEFADIERHVSECFEDMNDGENSLRIMIIEVKKEK